MATSVDDLKSSKFWRALAAEFVGTFFLVFVGCGSCIGGNDWENYSPTMVQISLCFGLAVATMVWCICHISGGHINPAVTAALLFTGHISIVRAIFYTLVQCLGSISGAGLLFLITPSSVHGNLGLTTVNSLLSVWQGLLVEMFITAVLVLTVFAACDGKRNDLGGSAPLAIGFSVTFCHLFAIKYTGSSMNPARTFGPAVVSNIWTNHWVYWCGPIAGGVAAGLLYEVLFAADASLKKTQTSCLGSGRSDSVKAMKDEIVMTSDMKEYNKVDTESDV